MHDYLLKFKEYGKLPYEEAAKILPQIRDNTNYDESIVPEYTLPSALDIVPDKPIQTAMDWQTFGRPAMLKLFSEQMYGRILPRPDSLSFQILTQKDDALDNTAIRQEIRITAAMANGKSFSFDVLFYAPKRALKKPVPAFVGLNFKGNHATTDETDVRMTGHRFGNPAMFDESTRGCQTHRWCFKELVKRGYASATACYHDIFPDRLDGWAESALSLFEDNLVGFVGGHDNYTSIGVWAWGLSRMMDLMESTPLVDGLRVAVHGHSRLGKTALWTGAIDQRFRIVISNCSGCGGAALARRMFGETYPFICNVFPTWFANPFRQYMGREEEMPFDQHELIALAAPRAVAVASATEDLWADPKGEFLAAKAAGEVYALFGSKGLPANDFPPPDTCISGDISYHCRTGKHDQTPFDWNHYMDLADTYLK